MMVCFKNLWKIWPLTIVTIVVLVILILTFYLNPHVRLYIATIPNTLLISIGISIATILAIAISLSILPIQKASESWTSAILQIFIHDTKTHKFIMSFCILIIVNFILVIIKPSSCYTIYLRYLSFISIAVTLDNLRWYYKHIGNLFRSDICYPFSKR